MKKMMLIAMVVMLGVNFANAHTYRSNVNRKQACQHHRIKQGVHNGSLTGREAAVLRMQQTKVKNYKQMAMADGHINPAERRLIDQTQQRTNKNIYRQKHDGQRRY